MEPPCHCFEVQRGQYSYWRIKFGPLTIRTFWYARKNNKKRQEHREMFRGWKGGPIPKHYILRSNTPRGSDVCLNGPNNRLEYEVPCEHLLPLAQPLGRAVRSMFWERVVFWDGTVEAHQCKEEVHQREDHLLLQQWSAYDGAKYKGRSAHVESNNVLFQRKLYGGGGC